jgi:hypothetical protein
MGAIWKGTDPFNNRTAGVLAIMIELNEAIKVGIFDADILRLGILTGP